MKFLILCGGGGITVKTATHLSYFLNTTVRTKKGTTGKGNSAVIGG
jgi:hypothetical protein